MTPLADLPCTFILSTHPSEKRNLHNSGDATRKITIGTSKTIRKHVRLITARQCGKVNEGLRYNHM